MQHTAKPTKEKPGVPSAGWGLMCPSGPSTKGGEGARLPGFPGLRAAGVNPLPAYKCKIPESSAGSFDQGNPVYTFGGPLSPSPRVMGRRCWVGLLVRSSLGSP